MKCLVSGATGFIGSHLCQQLAAAGASLTALSASGAPLPDGTPTLPVDLTLTEPDAQLLHDVDVVFHLAGIAHRRARPEDYTRLNYEATLRLARLAAGQGVRCFVFLSSVKAMGAAQTSEPRCESDCTEPVDPYGLSKWRAECALREEFADSAMSIVILRPALVYGPGAKGNLRLLLRGVRAGMPRPPALGQRSMVALQDLVELMCRIAEAAPRGVNTWIACDDEGYSTRTIYELMRSADGKGRGLSWLPLWCWRLAAALLDLRTAGQDEPSYNKLFGTELYSNAAVSAAMQWHPPGRLAEVVEGLVTADAGAQL